MGYNMFAYCLNNPIVYQDFTGNHAEAVNMDEDPKNDLWPDPMGGYNGPAQLSSSSQGFSSFRALKNFLGPPGANMHWHHFVEQCQIIKSGFPAEQIQNPANIVAVDATIHAQITGYYNTTTFDFTDGLSVRNWLAGQPFEVQLEFGKNVVKSFGVK